MIKVVRALYAASTLYEANYLPKLFHVSIISTNWIWFVNSFKCVSDGNAWSPGQRAEICERIASESLLKIRTTFYEVARHLGRVKTVVTNHLRKMFRSRKHKAAECNTTARINWDKTLKPIPKASTNLLLLGQAAICWPGSALADAGPNAIPGRRS